MKLRELRARDGLRFMYGLLCFVGLAGVSVWLKPAKVAASIGVYWTWPAVAISIVRPIVRA